MKTYICTCDKLINETMQMVDHFFPKYWPESDVIVLGYKNPSCDYKFAKFISLGKDTGSKDHCQQLFNYFSNIEDKHFIIGVDDQPLVSKVNQDIIDYLENIFKLKYVCWFYCIMFHTRETQAFPYQTLRCIGFHCPRNVK